MKIQLTVALLITTLLLAAVPDSLAGSKPKVTACIDPRDDLDAIIPARGSAAQIFEKAGIAIQWRSRDCPADAIDITLSLRTSPDVMPNSVAYALPNQGTRIVLFYDRLKLSTESYRFPNFLAHVLVHEITHILQGIHRHSEKGVMKAQWNPADLNRMDGMGLDFTSEDIELIHHGLERRAERLLAGR